MKQAEMVKRIDAMIRDGGRTHEAVARLAGVSPITLRGFLHKGRNIRIDRLAKILAVLRLELDIVEIKK